MHFLPVDFPHSLRIHPELWIIELQLDSKAMQFHAVPIVVCYDYRNGSMKKLLVGFSEIFSSLNGNRPWNLNRFAIKNNPKSNAVDSLGIYNLFPCGLSWLESPPFGAYSLSRLVCVHSTRRRWTRTQKMQTVVKLKPIWMLFRRQVSCNIKNESILIYYSRHNTWNSSHMHPWS